MEQYGIWSEASGGIVENSFWTTAEAEARIVALQADAPEDTMNVVPVCEQHPDWPADDCEECED